jgi:hypothetical protein
MKAKGENRGKGAKESRGRVNMECGSLLPLCEGHEIQETGIRCKEPARSGERAKFLQKIFSGCRRGCFGFARRLFRLLSFWGAIV